MSNRPRYQFVTLAVVAALVLAACGTASGTTSPSLPSLADTSETVDGTTTTTEVVDPEEAMREFATCMREHGVDMPDPSAEGGNGTFRFESDSADFGAFEEAEQECSPILEAAFGLFELTPEQEAELRDKELVFAQCMRDNGIDWPDPSSGGEIRIEIPAGEGIDQDAMDLAMEKCSQEAFGESFGGSGFSAHETSP